MEGGVFVRKTYEMVDDPNSDYMVCWGSNGNSFVVNKVVDFSTHLLPNYFKHNNFSSFLRQLNTYGKTRIWSKPKLLFREEANYLLANNLLIIHFLRLFFCIYAGHGNLVLHPPLLGFRKVDPDRWEFANEGFLRGQKHLLKIISRKKPSHVHNNTHHAQPQMQDKSTKSCVELGNFGMGEEVERLKRDKNVLMQELVRLRQEQQTTDHQLQTVGQRVQVMEQRQQQMMAFLAKAMQSPGFITQLVQQQSDSNNRRINGVNKKRRLPNQDEEFSNNSMSKPGLVSPNQMVKYRPLMNEAAKTMMGHIMKMNSSPRLEPSMSGSDFLLNNNMQSFADSSSSQTRLSKTLSISSHPYLSTEPEIPIPFPSPPFCESSPRVNVTTQQDAFVSGISPVHGLISESSSQVPGFYFDLSETGSTDFAGLVNEPTPVIRDDFPCDNLIDNVVLDEIPELPGINDVFWEQFLSVGRVAGERDEIDSESLKSCVSTELDWQKGQESGWGNIQDMTHLTEQMGLLVQRTQGCNSMLNNCPCSLGTFETTGL